ncbi:MAG: indolepyruvate oxidoreductase subunit beta [Thermoplasmata archaeon]
MSYNIFLAGVGGQGLVLLSNIIGNACAKADKKAVTGEQHGLSQRSGTVSIHLRIGEDAYSPLIPYGNADLLVSLEAIEALRYIEYLKPDGIIVMNKNIMRPNVETWDLIFKKKQKYLVLDDITQRLKEITNKIAIIDAIQLAKEAGNPLTENVVFLGAISTLKILPIEEKYIRESIAETVPQKALEQNMRAFDLGKKSAYDSLCKLTECKM